PVPPAWLPPDRALDDDAFRQPLIIAHPPRLYAHQVAALQVLRAIAAALVFDRGAAVVGQLHAASVPAAVKADQPRPGVDMGDRTAQVIAVIVAVAIAVIVSVAVSVSALADVAHDLDRTRPEFAPGLRHIDPDHVATLQAFHRALAPLVEQARALVVTHLRLLHAAAAGVVDNQEDAVVARINAVDGALQLAAVLRGVALVGLPVAAGIAAIAARADAAGEQQQNAGGEHDCD